MTRAVLHLDLDAFFASVEQRDKPSLRGRPVVVGGTGRRGVVATASYEARAFDIGSAMPTALARRRCPNAAYLAPRFAAYRTASVAVMELAGELSDVVEPLSLDEAYVDLSARLSPGPVDGLTDDPGATHASSDGPSPTDAGFSGLAELIAVFRARVREVTGLTVSVGLATNKLLAKVASDAGKPDGCVVVEPGTEAAVLAPLGVRALPGVGGATQARLATLGITTVGHLAGVDERELVGLLGRAAGAALHAASHGVDPRRVVAEREAKSVSAEETFPTDLVDRRELDAQVGRLAVRVAARLGATGASARTVTLKVRRYDFATLGRSMTLPRPVSGAAELAAAARSLLAAVDIGGGVRLLGVGVSGLTDHVQEDLLAELDVQAPQESETGPSDRVGLGDGAWPSDGPGSTLPASGEGADPAPLAPESERLAAWRPGQDVVHATHGPGWVQGSGLGRVTVRFEGPHTGVGRVRTLAVDDPDLTPGDPPTW